VGKGGLKYAARHRQALRAEELRLLGRWTNGHCNESCRSEDFWSLECVLNDRGYLMAHFNAWNLEFCGVRGFCQSGRKDENRGGSGPPAMATNRRDKL